MVPQTRDLYAGRYGNTFDFKVALYLKILIQYVISITSNPFPNGFPHKAPKQWNPCGRNCPKLCHRTTRESWKMFWKNAWRPDTRNYCLKSKRRVKFSCPWGKAPGKVRLSKIIPIILDFEVFLLIFL